MSSTRVAAMSRNSVATSRSSASIALELGQVGVDDLGEARSRRGRPARAGSGAAGGRTGPRRPASAPRRASATMLITSVWFLEPVPGTGPVPAYHRRPWPRVFSGIQPTGELTLGTYLGALRRWVADQAEHHLVFCIVDLHALTVPQDPAVLRPAHPRHWRRSSWPPASTPTLARCSCRATSPSTAELAWLMECTASFGELRRMTQFKDKSDRQRVRVRRAVHLPGADGRRHPPLRHRPGARGRRPAPAPRADPRRRRALQQPLRRHLRRARGRHPHGRRPGHGPAGADPQDVEVRSTRRRARS